MKKVLQKTNNSHFFKLINLMFFFFKNFFAVDISRHYAFYYNPNYKLLENGWALFQTEEEFAKLIHSADSDWRISYVNIDGSVSEIHVLLQNRKKIPVILWLREESPCFKMYLLMNF